ncbi:hypothetical protein [Qipengyuania atrilutea]|uniref:Uncharacterized protein n=1 Tax=Qipengyuania atrilutea TaxID=2744473 RepID=A0A850H3P7_9SPHN|nr:hypothetical protein [Actirhodobacter atriluteus]NVD44518.1 hypothetical protein [Actirhodobacter atriluteus]
MQQTSRPNYVNAAFASVAASVLLLAAPFAFPAIPLWPFLILNWLLFMSVGYLAFFAALHRKAFVGQSVRAKLVAFNSALLNFYDRWMGVVVQR